MKAPSTFLPVLFAAACASDGLDSFSVETLPPQGGNTDDETTEICPDAAHCQVAKTSGECERLLWEADGERPASIQITPLSNRLNSDGASLEDGFDTSDTVDKEEASRHFACALLYVGEWLSDGSTLTTRDGGALTVQVNFKEALLKDSTAAELCIGVESDSGARWGTFPNGDESCLSYIVTADGNFTY